MTVVILAGCQSDVSHHPSARTSPAGVLSPPSTAASTSPRTAPPTPAVGPDSLREVFGVSSQEAWLLTARRVLQTTDGANTWNDVSPDGMRQTATVSASLSLVGSSAWLVIGDDSRAVRVLRSTDRGASWTLAEIVEGAGGVVTSAGSTHLWLSVDLGAAMGSEGHAVYASGDGGSTWRKVSWTDPGGTGSIPFGCQKGPLSFATASAGWFGLTCNGGMPTLLKTLDGGVSWQQVPVIRENAGGGYSTEAGFFDESNGVAVVNSGHQFFLTTANGGRTWTQRANVKATGEPAILTPTTWFARDQGALEITLDSGRSWTYLGSAPPGEVHFLNVQEGWAVFPATLEVGRSTDGGRTWEHHSVPAAAGT